MADIFLEPFVRAVWQLLYLRLAPSKRLAIYGAGAHTRWLLSVVGDLPSPRLACIIDDHPTLDRINDVPVLRPDRIDAADFDVVLISSDQWEQNLADRARQLLGDRVEIVRLYENLPAGPYDKTDDRGEALQRLAQRQPAEPRTDGLVVMVADHPRSREAKLASALKHAGWRTVLLHRNPAAFATRDYFAETHRYSNHWSALRHAAEFAPVAYHVMVSGDYRVADTFVRHRPGPVIVDPYDVIAHMYTDDFLDVHPAVRKEIPCERYCLENADGLCCRHREVDHLVEQCGYRVAARVFVEDGCWNLDARPSRGSAGASTSLGTVTSANTLAVERQVAYVGAIHNPSDSGERGERASADFVAAGFSKPIAEALARSGVDVHLYSGSSCDPPKISHPRIHYHDPVPADRIAAELASHDFGALLYSEDVINTGARWFVTPAKINACTSNKLFDYLDAGLPILHNARPGSLIHEIVTRHCIGIDVSDWPIEQWRTRLADIRVDDFADELARARRVHDVRRNIRRLTEFYEQIRRSHETRTGPAPPSENDRHADGRRDHRPALV